jgi:hypothetical protein
MTGILHLKSRYKNIRKSLKKVDKKASLDRRRRFPKKVHFAKLFFFFKMAVETIFDAENFETNE